MAHADTTAGFHLEAFIAAQRRKSRAEGTLAKYRQTLDEFIAWVGDRTWDEISAQDIETIFLGQWETKFEARYGRRPAANTVRLRIAALKSLYTWLERMDYVSRNPMRRIDSPTPQKRINDWLRPAEDQAVLDAARTPIERIVVYWLRFTGERYCEGEYTLNKDIDLAPSASAPHGQVTIRKSKTTAGIRVIPILPALRPEIERWRAHQQALGMDAPELPFLGTKNHTAMKHTFIWRVVKRVANRACVRAREAPDKSGDNMSEVSPHTLRRTLGSSLINSGVPLNVVSKILGHSSTTITERAYAELTSESIAAQVLAHL